MSSEPGKTKNILATTDKFIAAVPWSDRRVVLVFRREHGGRTYVRVRTWNRHGTKHVWYPTKRFYVIPVERADALAEALRAAARDEPMEKKPRWYAAREKQDQERYERMVELEAPDAVIARQKRRLAHRKKSRV